MGGDLVIAEKPRLERSIIRYFRQGDYDLIEPEEYLALALYMKSKDLVEVTEAANAADIAGSILAYAEGKINIDELECDLADCGLDAMVDYIKNLCICLIPVIQDFDGTHMSCPERGDENATDNK